MYKWTAKTAFGHLINVEADTRGFATILAETKMMFGDAILSVSRADACDGQISV
ncbi:hypothetical protein ACODYM_29000 [Burkholderia gladioli]|uniref:hypothetical protein n=1 Tax=Burkholderia gladioli TaxID=28095 RepID=UPI003B5023B3